MCIYYFVLACATFLFSAGIIVNIGNSIEDIRTLRKQIRDLEKERWVR